MDSLFETGFKLIAPAAKNIALQVQGQLNLIHPG
jgi:hypothetical protein